MLCDIVPTGCFSGNSWNYRMSEEFDILVDKLINGADNASIKKHLTPLSELYSEIEYLNIIYLIALEKKNYEIVSVIADKYSHIDNDILFMEIYNAERAEIAELDFISRISWNFELPYWMKQRNKNDIYHNEYKEALYHLIKNSCYKAVEVYLEQACLFELPEDSMSLYIKLAAKKHDKKMLEIFAEKGFKLRLYDMGYLILHDKDYFEDVVIPLFYPDYDNNSAALYNKIFSDSERLAVYIVFILDEMFDREKLLYYRSNLLNISSVDINKVTEAVNITEYMYGGFLEPVCVDNVLANICKDLMLDTECCAKEVKIKTDATFISHSYENIYELIIGIFSEEIKLNVTQDSP